MNENKSGFRSETTIERKQSRAAVIVLFSAFCAGAAVFSLFPKQTFDFKFPIEYYLLISTTHTEKIFFWIASFSLPCLIVLFLSTTSMGCFFLPVLFMVFGAVSVFLFQHSALIAKEGFSNLFPVGLTMAFVFPSVFLFGEWSVRRSFAFFRFSRTGFPTPLPTIPGERITLSAAMLLMAAFVRQFVIPFILQFL